MSKIPLSIIILTWNEADTIERCLKSVEWCCDIVLLDDSTDQTVEIAQKTIPKSKLRIIPVTERKDFAKLRNFGLSKAKYEWVLFLDADEEVPYELKEEIMMVPRLHLPDARASGGQVDSTSSLSKNNYEGFYLKRKDFFLGKWLQFGETGNIKLLKLAKKSAGMWKRNVHEVWDIKGKIEELNSPLVHYPHPTISEFLNRINRWTDIDAQVFYEQGAFVSWWKIIVYPVGKFARNYFLKLGFCDGMAGLIMALMMSFHSFLTRAKLYMLQQNKKDIH